MKFKNLTFILAVLLIAAVALGSVSAAEDIADDTLAIDEVAEVEEVSEAPVVTDIDEGSEEAIDDISDVEEEVTDDDVMDTEETVSEDKTGADIQALIDAAADGGIVDLGENLVYVVQDGQTFDLTKKLAFVGNNVTIQASGVSQAGSGALFIANKAGTSFEGINFVNSDGHKEFGQEVSGYGVYLASENITVNNCKFIDWNSGIYGSGAAFCNITNCYFNGSSWAVTGAGKGEKGTKAINLMGCHDLLVKGCTFDGQVLDGISSASNSANLVVIDNHFIDNIYAIFFGGASTAGCVIANNTFIRCGYCPNVSAEVNKKIPVISTQKAANGYIITENNIEALDGTTFIMAESGNTAHGYPSLIGDINITANTMTAAEGADPATMTLVHILSNKGPLNPYAPINITGNTLDAGISPLVVWYNDWGNEYGNNPVIPAADKVATSINIKEISTASRKITIELVDVNGDVQAGKEISYSFNGGESLIGETDADGLLTIDVTEDGIVALAFAGDDKLKAAENTVNFASTAAKTATSIIVSEFNTTAVDGKTDGRVGKYFTWTLVDANGNPIANTPMQVGFNGVVYTYEKNGICTDENGVGKLQINLGYKGTYTFAICFLGNDLYNASFAVSKVNVAPQKGSLTVPNKSYSARAKTKTLTATFKSASGKPVADKKITFTVNGKTYTATTNAKGVASVNVSISKKGTYSFTAKYTTNGMYETMTKTAKLTIK